MKTVTKVLLLILVVLLTAAITFVATFSFVSGRYESLAETDPVSYKVEAVAAMLETYFIDDYEMEELVDAAADGAAESMIEATGDRWSYYISADEMAAYEEQMTNSYVGIGVTIMEVDGGMEIVSVTAGGPAEQAGIQVGDICIEAEGQKTSDLGLDGTKNVVRGKEGTMVKLKMQRGEEVFDLEVERRAIITPVAEWTMLEDDIALIVIYNFDAHCAEQTLEAIMAATNSGAEALIFDVRFNGGGYKHEMVEILDFLLPEGDLFISRNYEGKEEVDRSNAECLQLPMAVLVNAESYSAAEFFAVALQEYDAAEVVGVQTVGKGNFQYTLDLGDGSAVAISAGKYFTPSGKSLTDVGVTPDVTVDLDMEDYEALYYGTLAFEDDEQLQAALELMREKLS